MDQDLRIGTSVKRVRIRRGIRQQDVAERAGLSRATVSELELGHLDGLTVATIRAVCDVLDLRVDVTVKWRGGDLDRLLNARHSRLHEQIAKLFTAFPEWVVAPEVSFSIWGERGVIDILAWHAASRTLLVIELKTEFVDVNDLVGAVDRKERLAKEIGAGRGWQAAQVAVWVAVADSRRNRGHLSEHATMLRNAFPADGRAIAGWLRHPDRPLHALGFVKVGNDGSRLHHEGKVRVRLAKKPAA